MSAVPPQGDVKSCPQCHTDNVPTAKLCWLCQADLINVPIGRDKRSDPSWPAFVPTQNAFTITCAIALFVVMVILGALIPDAPVLGVAFGILAIPPLVITMVRVQVKQGRGIQVGWGERIAVFALTSLISMGVVALGCVAIFAALFAICVAGLGPNLH